MTASSSVLVALAIADRVDAERISTVLHTDPPVGTGRHATDVLLGGLLEGLLRDFYAQAGSKFGLQSQFTVRLFCICRLQMNILA